MNDALIDRAAHGPFDTMEDAFALRVQNHDNPPLCRP
jgi:hypothetical protein